MGGAELGGRFGKLTQSAVEYWNQDQQTTVCGVSVYRDLIRWRYKIGYRNGGMCEVVIPQLLVSIMVIRHAYKKPK